MTATVFKLPLEIVSVAFEAPFVHISLATLCISGTKMAESNLDGFRFVNRQFKSEIFPARFASAESDEKFSQMSADRIMNLELIVNQNLCRGSAELMINSLPLMWKWFTPSCLLSVGLLSDSASANTSRPLPDILPYTIFTTRITNNILKLPKGNFSSFRVISELFDESAEITIKQQCYKCFCVRHGHHMYVCVAMTWVVINDNSIVIDE